MRNLLTVYVGCSACFYVNRLTGDYMTALRVGMVCMMIMASIGTRLAVKEST